ncbi:MAG: hypothetical protein HKM01_08415 [Gallionella sp.]|nr:hypothetical protein [Gallionella sp.]
MRLIPMQTFRFNLAVMAFALVFLLLAGKSEAATGFWVNGLCYPDSLTAQQAFLSQYPKVSSGLVLSVSQVIFDPVLLNINALLTVVDATARNPVSSALVSLPINTCNTLLQLSPVIDSPSMLYAFTWGFTSIMFFFGLGLAINAAVTAIKKV